MGLSVSCVEYSNVKPNDEKFLRYLNMHYKQFLTVWHVTKHLMIRICLAMFMKRIAVNRRNIVWHT